MIEYNKNANDYKPQFSNKSQDAASDPLPADFIPLTTRKPKNGVLFNVIAYVRVSKDDELTGSHTLETQLARIREICDRKFGPGGYTFEMFQDDGISGGYGHAPTGMQKKTRPTLTRIAERLATGRYDALAFYDLSRLMRNPRAYHDFVEDCVLANHVLLLSATENLDLETAEGRFVAGILAGHYGMQRDKIITRNKDAARRRAEKGYIVGNPPFAWRYQDPREVVPGKRRGIEPVPEQAQIVRDIYAWYLSGWSTTRIAGELNRRGLRTVEGVPWRQESIRNIVASPVHSGQVVYDGKLYRGAHWEHRLWEPEDHDELLRVGEGRKKWHARSATEYVDVHLLEGFVFCHSCGRRLYTVKAQKEYRAYRCINGQTQGQRTCPHMSVQAQPLEQQIIGEIGRLAELPEMRALLEQEAELAAGRQDAELAHQKAQLGRAFEDVKAQMSRWSGLFSRGTLSEDQFTEHNAELLAEKTRLIQDLREAEAQLARRDGRVREAQCIKAAVLDFAVSWRHLNIEERRQVLSLLLETCTVERVGRDITLRIKVHLLPAREVLLMIPTGYKKKVEGIGSHTLTPRQLAFLHHVNQGKKPVEAGQAMGIAGSTVCFLMTDIRKRMGVHDIPECASQARSRIHSLLHSLPLGLLRPQSADGTVKLSEKLLAVFPMLAAGAKLEEVATELGLPVTTVAARKQEIVRRLGAKTIFEAGRKARALGLLH